MNELNLFESTKNVIGGGVLLYHGSGIVIENPDLNFSRKMTDFGTGFYCTKILDQAVRWSKRNKTPKVSSYKLNMNTDCDILNFECMSDDWLDFIVDCRTGVTHDYDIVMGPMVDDQIFSAVADYLDGNITRDAFWELAKFRKPTSQVAFCTTRSLEYLYFLREVF